MRVKQANINYPSNSSLILVAPPSLNTLVGYLDFFPLSDLPQSDYCGTFSAVDLNLVMFLQQLTQPKVWQKTEGHAVRILGSLLIIVSPSPQICFSTTTVVAKPSNLLLLHLSPPSFFAKH